MLAKSGVVTRWCLNKSPKMAIVDEVIQVDIESLSEEQIEQFKQAFMMFDKVG